MTRLVDRIKQETGADYPQIMLLRHFNSIDRLLELGGTVEEFTSLQPTGTKWGFWAADKPRIDVVVVIVRDLVHGVYRILGIEAEGTIGSLASEPHRAFDLELERAKLGLPARRFRLAEVPSAAVAVRVTGWEGREISPVLRSNGELFWAIEAELWDSARLAEEVEDAAKLHEGALPPVRRKW